MISPSLRNNKYEPWGSPPCTPLFVTSLDSPVYTRSGWAALSFLREEAKAQRGAIAYAPCLQFWTEQRQTESSLVWMQGQ